MTHLSPVFDIQSSVETSCKLVNIAFSGGKQKLFAPEIRACTKLKSQSSLQLIMDTGRLPILMLARLATNLAGSHVNVFSALWHY